MKLRIITPIITTGFAGAAQFTSLVRAGTEVSHVGITRGPASIESAFDEALAVPDTIARIVEAEQDGVDAVVINCMGDPGLKAGREAVSIPVIGPCEASMHVAAMLGHTFSILTVLARLRTQFEHLAAVYGLREQLASVRSVEIPVLDLDADRLRMEEALVKQAQEAVERDGAHVLIFGCTGMLGAADQVQLGLAARGHEDVPVIDPMVAAIGLAEALVGMRLSHSKRTYPLPPAKRIVGYDLSLERGAVPAD